MGSSSLAMVLEKARPFSFVVPFDPLTDKLLSFDLTVNNTSLTPELLHDTDKFIAYIGRNLKTAGCRYGIGGYAEHRTIYSSSQVFDGPQGEEPRRLHLGTDIWGPPGTPVVAPLAGSIHSFANNDRFGDYGATIILSHSLEGISFYTLYGHLGLDSIKNLVEGNSVRKGEKIAELGIPAENGQWPPHLHFQLIDDIGEWKGDYPGVSKFSEKEKWLLNSPDPDIILDMNKYIKVNI